jgi:superfamily II DNA or RNA helicase
MDDIKPNPPQLVIMNHNETYIKVHCEESIAWELRDAFSFRPPGFQFVPSFKQKLWDGFLRLFNVTHKTIYRGLAPDVIDWATSRGYTYEYKDAPYDESFSATEAEEFITKLNPKHKPRDYQVNAFIRIIRNKRGIVLSPTGSGKSLLLYMLSNYLLKQGKRGLIIVPRAALVEQLFTDFQDYSTLNGKNMHKYCWKVYSGKDKNSEHPIMISTWQSIYKMPQEFFDKFDYVICDEVHLAAAKSLTDIMSKCTKATHRIGVTGTLSGAKAHDWVLKGLFGSIYRATTSAELMAKKQLAELKIKCLLLKYSDDECNYMRSVTYIDELKYIITNKERNKMIVNLALSLEGNTLLLFNFVEHHGKVLYDMLNTRASESGRKVFFIHGGTNVTEREQIRSIVETEKDAIIVGSVGVLSTGTNIISLSNVIFASPSKSKIRNLQSVGRSLRVSDTKQSATLYDIADDFSWKNKENHTLRHFFERIKIYSEEEFKFKIYKIKINK